MIFVIVGMHHQGFDRLIKKMDQLATFLNEEVIMQIGASAYIPKNTKYFDYIDDEQAFLNIFNRARVVVSHAGAGTISTALKLKKPLIVMPRQKKYGEHNDDQQTELANQLGMQGAILVVHEDYELFNALKHINNFCPYIAPNLALIKYLKVIISHLE